MPMQFSVTLGTNRFTAEGEFVFDACFRAVFQAWLNVHAPDTDAQASELAGHVTRIDDAGDALGDLAQQLGGIAPDPPTTS